MWSGVGRPGPGGATPAGLAGGQVRRPSTSGCRGSPDPVRAQQGGCGGGLGRESTASGGQPTGPRWVGSGKGCLLRALLSHGARSTCSLGWARRLHVTEHTAQCRRGNGKCHGRVLLRRLRGRREGLLEKGAVWL